MVSVIISLIRVSLVLCRCIVCVGKEGWVGIISGLG